jgi:hypothetical protein
MLHIINIFFAVQMRHNCFSARFLRRWNATLPGQDPESAHMTGVVVAMSGA